MSAIGGKKREALTQGGGDFKKYVGLFEGKVISVNPDAEVYKELLGMELKEDSKALNYLGKTEEGNIKLRLDIWIQEIKNGDKFKATFFLEDKEKENKDQTKKQYINAVGVCSWADDPNNLPTWFADREYRVAYVGEEEFYSFLRTWLGELDLRDAESTLQLDWNKLMRGNVRDIQSQINGEYSTNIVVPATIKTVIKDDETKEYQGVWTKGFLPAYSLKQFRLVDYSNSNVLNTLRGKKSKDLKPHERFVLNITGEYGCRDYFTLKDLAEYNSGDNLVASDKVIADDDSEF